MIKEKGFTLIEVLICVILLAFLIMGSATLLSNFGIYTRDRQILTCLIEAASSAIEACRTRTQLSSVPCGPWNVSVSVSGNCTPSSETCSDITATATIAISGSTRTISLQDKVCNPP